jgi:hypothetical protein
LSVIVTFRIGPLFVDMRIALVWEHGFRIVLCRMTRLLPPSDWNPSKCSGPLQKLVLSGHASLLRSGPTTQSESWTVTVPLMCAQSEPLWKNTRRAVYPSNAIAFESSCPFRSISTSSSNRPDGLLFHPNARIP